MSNTPTPSAQKKIQSQPDKDTIQWRDSKNQVQAFVSYDGTFHTPGDGSGYLPTLQASLIISTAPYVGVPPINLLQIMNTSGQIIGWISGSGQLGGALSSWAKSPVASNPVNGVRGWIDPSGNPSGVLG